MHQTLAFLFFLALPAQETASLRQAAILRAVDRVAAGVVAIETSGGTDVLGQPAQPGARPGAAPVRRGTGPTTGLVVGADGWIVSSAFNLANQPASVVVSVGGRRHLAKIVSTDSSRMLTLLKIDASGLTVPESFPVSQLQVGMTSLALGRALSPASSTAPSVSEGIVSALGRIAGKAIQTDAKVSPVNYGGPLLSLDGRVLGILVPASPDAEGATAGFEWYDSGIGFAIPLDDLKRVLPILQKGNNLSRGVLGVTMAQGDPFRAAPKLSGVRIGSPAEKAGLKVGDVITQVNAVAVATQGQFQRQLGPLYQGEKVSLEYLRDGKKARAEQVELMAPESSRPLAMLGITPLREVEGQGVVIRSLIPGGPAEKAGLKVGDRLVGLVRDQGPPAPLPIANSSMLAALVESADIGQTLKLVVRRVGKEAKGHVFAVLASLVLELGHPRHPAHAGDAVEDPAQFDMGGHLTLVEQDRPCRINPGGDEGGGPFAGLLAQFHRVLPDGDGMHVDHAIDRLDPFVLLFDKALQRAEVIAEGQAARGLDA